MLSIHLSYDPIITLLSDSQEEMKLQVHRRLCKSFTSALSIIAKYWKHPRSSSAWGLVKPRYLCTMEQYCSHKEWMDTAAESSIQCVDHKKPDLKSMLCDFIYAESRTCADRNQQVVPEGSGQETDWRGESLGWWKGPLFCLWWRLHWYLKLSKLIVNGIFVCLIVCKFY